MPRTKAFFTRNLSRPSEERMKFSKEIQVLAGRADNLPTLPGIAIRLLEAVKKTEPNITEIGVILSNDSALTAKLLKLVNSSFYGLSSKVTTVDHAIKLLGLNTVKNLALSFSLTTGLSNKAIAINYDQFWKDSLFGAIAAKLLADKIHPQFAEDAFFLGLLQDIGSLALAFGLPDQYSLILSEANKQVSKYHPAESQHLGLNHMELGEYLTRSWGLPETFYIPIGHHHEPQNLPCESRDCGERAKILHLSSLYIDVFNTSDINFQVGAIGHFCKEYGFAGRLDSAELAKEIHQQARDVFMFFDVPFKEDRDYVDLLNTAKSEMAKLSTEMIAEPFEKNRQIEFLKEQATTDSMTSIHNYKGFSEFLSREINHAKRYNKPLSLIFADIDHFKEVNDTFGHQPGDYAVKAVATALQKQLRGADYLARYGGEEFAVVLPETDIMSAFPVAERLRETIKSLKIVYKEKAISVTMSFGVACMPPNKSLSSDSLIKMADNALYRAKNQGRNCCCMIDRDGNCWSKEKRSKGLNLQSDHVHMPR
jgi:two-component system, cell cycle response regulator